MKKIVTYIALICISGYFMSSCTSGFEKMNTPPSGITDEELMQDNNYIGMHFPTIQKSIYWNNTGNGWEFQLTQNLTSDVWCGYMASPSNFKGGINTQTYSITHDWCDNAWIYTYRYVMSNQLRVREKCEEMGMEQYGHFNAINTILRVMAMQRVCDEYGPIIYSHYGESKTGGLYDSAQEAYKMFFAELTEASNVLDLFSKKDEYISFEKFDMSPYYGNLKQWMRLSNSLRLRLAMRIVKYDVEWARSEAEAAISAPGGLMHVGDHFRIKGYGWQHPLYTCSREYNDTFLNASLLSILKGYDDPRLYQIGIPKNNNILGVRSGIPGLGNTVSKYKEQISHLRLEPTDPAILMTVSETYFLLAEAALRGWKVDGTAKSYYEQGVISSFVEFGVPLGDYLESSKVPADWVDPVDSSFDAPAVSTVSPRWDDAKTDRKSVV